MDYNTGDIILFSDTTFLPSKIIEKLSASPYSHVGMVLRDPVWINEKLVGLYLFESTGLTDIPEVESGELRQGVQIRPLQSVIDEYNGSVFWRKVNCNRDDQFNEKLSEAHKLAHAKPYDLNPWDWLRAMFGVKVGGMTDKRFFCSALVAWICSRVGLLDSDTAWTIVRPCDLSEQYSGGRVKWLCEIECEKKIK